MAYCEMGVIFAIGLVLFVDKIMLFIGTRYLAPNMTKIITFVTMIDLALLALLHFILNITGTLCT